MPKFNRALVVTSITEEAICLSAPLDVETLDDIDHGKAGDWLITSVHGGKYVCKRAKFLKTYKPADAQAEAYLERHK